MFIISIFSYFSRLFILINFTSFINNFILLAMNPKENNLSWFSHIASISLFFLQNNRYPSISNFPTSTCNLFGSFGSPLTFGSSLAFGSPATFVHHLPRRNVPLVLTCGAKNRTEICNRLFGTPSPLPRTKAASTLKIWIFSIRRFLRSGCGIFWWTKITYE